MADAPVPCRGEGQRFPAGQFRKQSGYVIHWVADPRHTIDGEPWPPPDLPTDIAYAGPLDPKDIADANEEWYRNG